MRNFLKRALILVAGLASFSIAQAADTTISSGGVTATINDTGTFASYYDAGGLPPMGSPGLSYNGVEFINIDVPSSWWWLSAGGTDYVSQYGSVAAPLGTLTTGSSGATAAYTSNLPSGLGLFISWSIPTSNQLAVQVNITNNSASSLSDVSWGVGFDPDQGGSGNNTTLNTILAQGAGSALSAFAGGYKVTLGNTTAPPGTGIGAYIGTATGCCGAVDPSFALANGQAPGFTTWADQSISLAYRIGALGAGQTATLGYSYTFAQAVPEPEIYAMMVAGLGLMGWVARRRKVQVVA